MLMHLGSSVALSIGVKEGSEVERRLSVSRVVSDVLEVSARSPPPEVREVSIGLLVGSEVSAGLKVEASAGSVLASDETEVFTIVETSSVRAKHKKTTPSECL